MYIMCEHISFNHLTAPSQYIVASKLTFVDPGSVSLVLLHEASLPYVIRTIVLKIKIIFAILKF